MQSRATRLLTLAPERLRGAGASAATPALAAGAAGLALWGLAEARRATKCEQAIAFENVMQANKGCGLPFDRDQILPGISSLRKLSLQDRHIEYKEFMEGVPEGSTWVHFKGGVFDMTSFVEAHPGGTSRIEMVNHCDLGKFWEVYKLHDRPHILELIEQYRIGYVSEEDSKRIVADTTFSDAYGSDPERPREKELRVVSKAPWNSEPANLEVLSDSFFTPNDVFFVRNHNPVPEVSIEDYTLEIEANPDVGILRSVSFTYEDLKTKFPKTEVVSALQCAGNRQEDFITMDRPLYVAPHWRNGAIGCARWGGVRIRDVLRAAGMDVDGMSLGTCPNPEARICNFIALDQDETGVPYAGVIPIEKAIDPFGDAILAYEMNGETLPKDHGYPVRLMATGTAGCRNVKWVSQLIVSKEASELDSGSRLDRHFAPEIGWASHREHVAEGKVPGWQAPDREAGMAPVRVEQGPVIQTLPVQSIISVPQDRCSLAGDLDYVTVKGVAWSGGGRGITRVEVSLDDGNTFSAADLVTQRDIQQHELATQRRIHGVRHDPPPEAGMGRNYGWVQYSKRLPIPASAKKRLQKGEKVELEICAKAIDGDFNSQPEKMGHLWNVLGICVNHWPRVTVYLDPNQREATKPAPGVPVPGSCVWEDGYVSPHQLAPLAK